MSDVDVYAKCPICGMIGTAFWFSEEDKTYFDCDVCGTHKWTYPDNLYSDNKQYTTEIQPSYGKVCLADAKGNFYALYPFTEKTPNTKFQFNLNELLSLFSEHYQIPIPEDLHIVYQYLISDNHIIITKEDFKILCKIEAYKSNFYIYDGCRKQDACLGNNSICKVDTQYILLSDITHSFRVIEDDTEYSHTTLKVISELRVHAPRDSYGKEDYTDYDVYEAYGVEKQKILRRFFNKHNYPRLQFVVINNHKEKKQNTNDLRNMFVSQQESNFTTLEKKLERKFINLPVVVQNLDYNYTDIAECVAYDYNYEEDLLDHYYMYVSTDLNTDLPEEEFEEGFYYE